ncbi:hypothetical protein [Eleftheria terrae]|uniref:hypothetical protein n=1 Tax=Eleftheria terrae TaxID=1597781 RepID=UPI00263B52A6|nr:hypothetical protein [Eleftheria terrae]WKB55690.1 hypothetical protein N7L95_26845 [Eleftheria terrae]
MRAVAYAFVALLAAGLPACGTPELPSVPREGFEAFSTPRSFDGPGTIYRIDADKKRFLVTTVVFKASGGGVEYLPSFASKRELSLSSLIETIGLKAEALPASAQGKLGSTRMATVQSVGGRRAVTSDEDVEGALRTWATTAQPMDGSVYYLIRETIATEGLTYKVSHEWLAQLGLDAQALNSAGYRGEVRGGASDVLELDAKFPSAMNVWFKAEKVVFNKALGVAGSQYNVVRTTAQGELGL